MRLVFVLFSNESNCAWLSLSNEFNRFPTAAIYKPEASHFTAGRTDSICGPLWQRVNFDRVAVPMLLLIVDCDRIQS